MSNESSLLFAFILPVLLFPWVNLFYWIFFSIKNRVKTCRTKGRWHVARYRVRGAFNHRFQHEFLCHSFSWTCHCLWTKLNSLLRYSGLVFQQLWVLTQEMEHVVVHIIHFQLFLNEIACCPANRLCLFCSQKNVKTRKMLTAYMWELGIEVNVCHIKIIRYINYF